MGARESPLMAEHEPFTLPDLPPRAEASHKGTFGRVLIIGGSRGMTGAACLAASAALRSGAGLVTVALPGRAAAIVPAAQPCAMTLALPESEDGMPTPESADALLELASRCQAIVLGPGLGWTDATAELVVKLLTSIPCPAVVDADALNGLSQRIDALESACAPLVLTPHPGEMRRLAPDADIADREVTAKTFANRFDGALVLKGHGTVISDGERTCVNRTGNPGMATGGSGDVLSGVIGALLGQGLPAFEAAALGAHVHGHAGDLAARDHGPIGLIATDLVDRLGPAFLTYREAPAPIASAATS